MYVHTAATPQRQVARQPLDREIARSGELSPETGTELRYSSQQASYEAA